MVALLNRVATPGLVAGLALFLLPACYDFDSFGRCYESGAPACRPGDAGPGGADSGPTDRDADASKPDGPSVKGASGATSSSGNCSLSIDTPADWDAAERRLAARV